MMLTIRCAWYGWMFSIGLFLCRWDFLLQHTIFFDFVLLIMFYFYLAKYQANKHKIITYLEVLFLTAYFSIIIYFFFVMLPHLDGLCYLGDDVLCKQARTPQKILIINQKNLFSYSYGIILILLHYWVYWNSQKPTPASVECQR
jgi:hypothetical protein